MAQKYIEGDIVEYDNKIMVIKEPRDRSHFDLYCPKEGVTKYYVISDLLNPVRLDSQIIEKNGIKKKGKWYELSNIMEFMYMTEDIAINGRFLVCIGECKYPLTSIRFVHQLQHLFFGLGLHSEMKV